MKRKDRFLLAVLSVLLVLSIHARPMWWGVLFPPLAEQLTMSHSADDSGICWKSGDRVLRFRSLDLLLRYLEKWLD